MASWPVLILARRGMPPLTPCPPVLKVFACQLLRELSLSLILLNSDFQFFRKTSTVAIKLYLWPQMSDLDDFWTQGGVFEYAESI